MSKNKSKLRWMYVTEPFNVYVDPKQVKRVHAPLEKSLTFEPEYRGYCLHLRTCERGMDEYGATVKYLYCTRDERFFVRGKDGWDEVLPSNASKPRNNSKCGGAYDAPSMAHFGHKYCHRCVAVAWCNPPQEALETINDRHAKKKWEVDHLNTDHKNWTADNLQWITADENRRRAKIARRMRQIALDPKLLTPTLCKGIYTLPEERFGEFVGRYLLVCDDCGNPMDKWSIRMCVAIALDIIGAQMNESEINEDK